MKIKNIIERVMSSVFFFLRYHFRCRRPAHYRLYGNRWSACHSGNWSHRVSVKNHVAVIHRQYAKIWYPALYPHQYMGYAWRRCHRCPHRRMFCHLYLPSSRRPSSPLSYTLRLNCWRNPQCCLWSDWYDGACSGCHGLISCSRAAAHCLPPFWYLPL